MENPETKEVTQPIFYFLPIVLEDGSALADCFPTKEEAMRDWRAKEIGCQQSKITIIRASIVETPDAKWGDVFLNAMKEGKIKKDNEMVRFRLSGKMALKKKLKDYKRPVQQKGVTVLYEHVPT